MQYDAGGNVTKIIDGVNSETVDYTYDDLDRLLTASVPTGESFAYDTIGNMTTSPAPPSTTGLPRPSTPSSPTGPPRTPMMPTEA